MNKCKFTIITVCYNAGKDIATTIKSVLFQTYDDFEYIIKDGESSDSTMDIVHSLTDNDNRVMIMQGKDKGIYDAMNKAVLEANGEFVLFLNAGDVLHEKDTLKRLSEYMEKKIADVYYGNFLQINIVDFVENRTERVYNQNSIKKIQYAIGKCICHQAILANRELFSDKCFDIEFQVCADREWQLYCLTRGRYFRYVPIVISDVLTDGFSNQHVDILERETEKCVKKYCKHYLWIYNSVMFAKKSSLIRKLFQKLEALFWVKKSEKDE